MMRVGKIWSTIKKTLDPQGPFRSFWTIMFALSCIVGVLIDPLFFYIPSADQDYTCIDFHEGLKKITFTIRSIADIPYVLHVIYQIRSIHKMTRIGNTRVEGIGEIFRLLYYKNIVIDIWSVIPVLQVMIFFQYSQRNTSTSISTWRVWTVDFLMQFFPRVVRVYLVTIKLSRVTGQVWLQIISFSIFQFVLASYVLGSFWYVSSIQQLVACWKQYSCGNDPNCEIRTLFCENPAFRNTTLLNHSCQPTNPPNTTLYDYGIFLYPIESRMVATKNLLQKLLHCFWWGLQNLSSLGQKLETTTDVYENFFAIFIFFSGMAVYTVSLNGNLQLMKNLGREKKIKQKMERKDKEIGSWLSIYSLNDVKMKKVIMDYVKAELEENKDVHLETIHYILPALQHETDPLYSSERDINYCLRMACLKKVPALEDRDQQILNAICVLLRPVTYPEASYIIREGEPVDMMLFITQGLVRVYTTEEGGRIDSSRDICLDTGKFYGQELIDPSPSNLPITNRIVKSVTRVGAFALMANDLENALRPPVVVQ